MFEQLEITEVQQTDVVQLLLRGELDVATAHPLGDRLNILLGQHRAIELDLSGLSFIDSTGLGVLVRATEAAETSGGAVLSITAMSDAVRRVVQLTGLEARLCIAARTD